MPVSFRRVSMADLTSGQAGANLGIGGVASVGPEVGGDTGHTTTDQAMAAGGQAAAAAMGAEPSRDPGPGDVLHGTEQCGFMWIPK